MRWRDVIGPAATPRGAWATRALFLFAWLTGGAALAATPWDGGWGVPGGPNHVEIAAGTLTFSVNGKVAPIVGVEITADHVLFTSGNVKVRLDRTGPKSARYTASDQSGAKTLTCNTGACVYAGFIADFSFYGVKPSEADPAITRYNEPHQVVIPAGVNPAAPLVVFLPGTGGKPANASGPIGVAARQGYPVIGLMYNDEPAVIQVCPQNPNPACSAQFRDKRIFGNDVTAVVDNTRNEAIVPRLVNLLRLLDKQHPQDKWSRFLAADGSPNWSRIVLAGMSQGAGMAAYIAKQRQVARVVLLSSPWDYLGPFAAQRLAPWLADPSATPPPAWFAAYNARENAADLLAKSYRLLGVPEANIRVFRLDLRPGAPAGNDNPYHGDVEANPAYADEWRFLFGKAP